MRGLNHIIVLVLLVLLCALPACATQPQQRTLRVVEAESSPEPSPEPAQAAPDPSEPAPGWLVRRVMRLEPQGGAEDSTHERSLRRVMIETGSGETGSGETGSGEAGADVARLLQSSDERFVCPVSEPSVSSPYGMRHHPILGRNRMHRGTDYRGPRGTPVYATASGRAIMAGWCDSGTGNCIVIDHPHGWRSQYFHLSRVRVENGDWVAQGQHIGDIGSTGRSTGPHLHFQLGRTGEAVDPEPLLGEPLDR